MPIKIEPPYWFSGMRNRKLQLMISGEELSDSEIVVNIPHTYLHRTIGVNSDYAIIDLELSEDIVTGEYSLQIDDTIIPYFIKPKRYWQETTDSISIHDSVYLLMPDRFARGREEEPIAHKVRKDPNAWHGGNLRGVIDHLDYLSKLGITALWMTPVVENNMPNEGDRYQYSFYHGYAATDYYVIDFRFGSLPDYIELVEKSHERGIKVIKDFVFNHCGSNHPWFHNPPMTNWFSVNKDGKPVMTNYKISTVFDPYAPLEEKEATVNGWFTPNMPNLNLHNPYLLQYMIQMTIWWIETCGIDAIRMDTYPYVDMECMIEWQKRLQLEYPGFSVIAETWEAEAAFTAKIQETVYEAIPKCSFIVMDFAFQKKIIDMVKRGDALELYNHFAYDFLYSYPKRLLSFLDNHDMRRWLSEISEPAKLRQALAILFTTPRIPQLFYGTEILLFGDGKGKEDGDYRQDFPGGWPEDMSDKFKVKNRTQSENAMFRFISKLLTWRKKNQDIISGRMTHYIPLENVLVFFRESENLKIMVIVNLADKRMSLSLDRFQKEVFSYNYGKDIITRKRYGMNIDSSLPLSSNSVKILNLE